MSTPEEILSIYDRHGKSWAETRNRKLFEKPWLDRFLSRAPTRVGGRRILDLGCGAGRPIAEYMSDRGCSITGVDGSASMIDLFAAVLPKQTAVHADMRGLDLGETFDGILAWDSFFHLSQDDQAAMFETFRHHCEPHAALMFTSGPEDGIAIGQISGVPIYHSSFAPNRYRELLEGAGFEVLDFVPEDQSCAGHSVWLARATV